MGQQKKPPLALDRKWCTLKGIALVEFGSEFLVISYFAADVVSGVTLGGFVSCLGA